MEYNRKDKEYKRFTTVIERGKIYRFQCRCPLFLDNRYWGIHCEKQICTNDSCKYATGFGYQSATYYEYNQKNNITTEANYECKPFSPGIG